MLSVCANCSQSVILAKVFSPSTQLKFSDQLCVIQRGDDRFLSFRLMHPQGHVCTDVDLSATWLSMKQHRNGEKHAEMISIPFDTTKFSNTLYLVWNLTHKLDDNSPLKEYVSDVSKVPGYMRVVVRGQNGMLQATFQDSTVFFFEDAFDSGKQYRWKDSFVKYNHRMGGCRLSKRRALIRTPSVSDALTLTLMSFSCGLCKQLQMARWPS